jgi:hypothetical protein
VRQGMAAWIRAWSSCQGPQTRATPPNGGGGTPLPDGVRGDVTRLLVTMALCASRREPVEGRCARDGGHDQESPSAASEA